MQGDPQSAVPNLAGMELLPQPGKCQACARLCLVPSHPTLGCCLPSLPAAFPPLCAPGGEGSSSGSGKAQPPKGRAGVCQLLLGAAPARPGSRWGWRVGDPAPSAVPGLAGLALGTAPFLKGEPLAVLPEPLQTPAEGRDPLWVRGSHRGLRRVPEGSQRRCPPSPRGGDTGPSRALPREEGLVCGIRIPWARAESRPRGVCRQAGGGGCQAQRGAQPRLQPLSRASPPLMSLQGQRAPFPEPVSPVNSCCDVPSFLLSLSLRSLCYDSCLPMAANGRAYKTNHSPLPLGRETDNSSPALETARAAPGLGPARFMSG